MPTYEYVCRDCGEPIAEARAAGTAEKLAPLALIGPGIPRQGNPVVDIDGETVGLEKSLSYLFDPDRDVRRRAAEAVTAGLKPGLKTRAYILNTLLHDKAVNDRLRGYRHWLQSRNLSNEASDESVQALLSAVVEVALDPAARCVDHHWQLSRVDAASHGGARPRCDQHPRSLRRRVNARLEDGRARRPPHGRYHCRPSARAGTRGGRTRSRGSWQPAGQAERADTARMRPTSRA